MSEIGILDFKDSSASFSPCRRYRYALWRSWYRTGNTVMFIGLNPSTADETENDPTIRRCLGFARDWGFGRLLMVNLFAFIATKPRDLWMARDGVGLHNDHHLVEWAKRSSLIIAAWGADPFPSKLRRAEEVVALLVDFELHTLGFTMAGHPRHPLYLRKDTKPQLWERRKP